MVNPKFLIKNLNRCPKKTSVKELSGKSLEAKVKLLNLMCVVVVGTIVSGCSQEPNSTSKDTIDPTSPKVKVVVSKRAGEPIADEQVYWKTSERNFSTSLKEGENELYAMVMASDTQSPRITYAQFVRSCDPITKPRTGSRSTRL